MDIILAPDVYVNASVALGSPPEQVVRRVLSKKGASKSTEWILARVKQMLRAVPAFKGDAVETQLQLIRELVEIVATPGEHGGDAWAEALCAAAQAAGVKRVVTDHPDLLEAESKDGVDFVSSEAWLLESATPPPPPPSGKKAAE